MTAEAIAKAFAGERPVMAVGSRSARRVVPANRGSQ
jgi:hypothetical protein